MSVGGGSIRTGGRVNGRMGIGQGLLRRLRGICTYPSMLWFSFRIHMLRRCWEVYYPGLLTLPWLAGWSGSGFGFAVSLRMVLVLCRFRLGY